MTRRATRTINQHRTDRRLIGIAHRKASVTIRANQFIAGLPGVFRLRIRIDGAGGEERFLHVAPAARLGMRVGPLVGNRRRAQQLRIDGCEKPANSAAANGKVDFPVNDRNDLRGLDASVGIVKTKRVVESIQARWRACGRREESAEAGEKKKGEINTSHESVLYEGKG